MREELYYRLAGLAGVLLLVLLFRILVRRLMKERLAEDDERRYLLNKIVMAVSWVVVLLTVVWVLAGGGIGLGAVLGLGTLGVAYALQDIIASVAGWFVAVGGRGFSIGDRIRIGDTYGDVVDISLLRTWLMQVDPSQDRGQSTGILVSFPNNLLLRQPLFNFTTGTRYVWQELSFTITYESDWQAAEQILLEATKEIDIDRIIAEARREIRGMVGRFRVRFGTLTPIVYVWPGDYGVQLTLRHLTEARRRRIHRNLISRYVLRHFAEHPRIEFAYPTKRIIPTPPADEPGEPDVPESTPEHPSPDAG